MGKAVDHRDQTAGSHQRAKQVEATALRRGLAKESGRQPNEQDADRDVDEQRPPPRHLGERTAQNEADRGARPGHCGVDGEGAVAWWSRRERRRDQRQGGWRDDGGADSLQGPGPEQPGLALGHAAEQRRQREQPDASHEHAAPAEQVTRAAAEQE